MLRPDRVNQNRRSAQTYPCSFLFKEVKKEEKKRIEPILLYSP